MGCERRDADSSLARVKFGVRVAAVAAGVLDAFSAAIAYVFVLLDQAFFGLPIALLVRRWLSVS
jgi:hypothetical protein